MQARSHLNVAKETLHEVQLNGVPDGPEDQPSVKDGEAADGRCVDVRLQITSGLRRQGANPYVSASCRLESTQQRHQLHL